jgi:hypothetical protein
VTTIKTNPKPADSSAGLLASTQEPSGRSRSLNLLVPMQVQFGPHLVLRGFLLRYGAFYRGHAGAEAICQELLDVLTPLTGEAGADDEDLPTPVGSVPSAAFAAMQRTATTYLDEVRAGLQRAHAAGTGPREVVDAIASALHLDMLVTLTGTLDALVRSGPKMLGQPLVVTGDAVFAVVARYALNTCAGFGVAQSLDGFAGSVYFGSETSWKDVKRSWQQAVASDQVPVLSWNLPNYFSAKG